MYSKGILKVHRAGVPVISVGNITTGGTGKTPLVIWIAQLLSVKNIRCAILTRGYKTRTGALSDEPAILTKSCPEAKVIVNSDRVAAAAKAVEQFGAKLLIMDDGFQHRRLHRDLDIVTIDATEPFGYDKILPAGLLREPVKALRRADAAVITRCDQISETELDLLEMQLLSLNSDLAVARSVHTPTCAKLIAGKKISLEQLRENQVFAFCGIGNPAAFFNTVKSIGANLVGSKTYNDHHQYTSDDIADIYKQAKDLHADLILSTQKDWTKTALLASAKNDMLFAFLQIELRFISREQKITQLIKSVLTSRMSEP